MRLSSQTVLLFAAAALLHATARSVHASSQQPTEIVHRRTGREIEPPTPAFQAQLQAQLQQAKAQQAAQQAAQPAVQPAAQPVVQQEAQPVVQQEAQPAAKMAPPSMGRLLRGYSRSSASSSSSGRSSSSASSSSKTSSPITPISRKKSRSSFIFRGNDKVDANKKNQSEAKEIKLFFDDEAIVAVNKREKEIVYQDKGTFLAKDLLHQCDAILTNTGMGDPNVKRTAVGSLQTLVERMELPTSLPESQLPGRGFFLSLLNAAIENGHADSTYDADVDFNFQMLVRIAASYLKLLSRKNTDKAIPANERFAKHLEVYLDIAKSLPNPSDKPTQPLVYLFAAISRDSIIASGPEGNGTNPFGGLPVAQWVSAAKECKAGDCSKVPTKAELGKALNDG